MRLLFVLLNKIVCLSTSYNLRKNKKLKHCLKREIKKRIKNKNKLTKSCRRGWSSKCFLKKINNHLANSRK